MFKLKSIFSISSLAATLAACTFALMATAQSSNVVPLNPPQPVENDGKIEVIEFFAYGCIHCAQIEPKLEEWIKRQPADVKVKRVPAGAGFNIRGIDSVPIFYTLEAMGLLDKLTPKIFTAANVENIILGNPATLNKWLEKQGVDVKIYENIQKSFSVQNKIARAYKMTVDYKPTGTPTFVVNGRYGASLTQSGEEQLFATVDKLVADARASNKPVSHLAAPAKDAISAKAKTKAKKEPQS